MTIDKRRHERIKADGFVRYSDAFRTDDPQKLQKTHEGHLVDMCRDGVCICTRHEFDYGSIMQFDIKERFEPNFTGIVKRCIRYSDDIFHIGLEVPFKLI